MPGRCFLQHFLMAPLHGAVALEKVDAASVPVGEHLDLDVPGPVEVFLQQHAFVAESRQGLAPARSERRVEFRLVFDLACLCRPRRRRP